MARASAFIDLFSGIGGFALAAYWSGLRFDRHYFSEVNGYAAKLYQERFPEAMPLGDIKNADYSKLPKGSWLAAGGFPCQPHSLAGKRKGSKDERDLWPECARMLRELRPAVALFENVPSLLVSDGGRFFNRVLSDISEGGYDAEWQTISAQEAGAPHRRERVWIVCRDPDCGDEAKERRLAPRQNAEPSGTGKGVADADLPPPPRQRAHGREALQAQPQGAAERFGFGGGAGWWAAEPGVGRVADGVPSRVDRLRGLGNAIVPQCAEMIFNLPVFDRWRSK